MTDREKVIASLDSALVQMHGCGRYTPEDVDELETAAWKALELLKEQDAVKPIPPEDEFGLYRCGKCYHQLFRCADKYCSRCGQKVKWE